MSDNPNKDVASAIDLLFHSIHRLTLNDKMVIHAIHIKSKETPEINADGSDSMDKLRLNDLIYNKFTVTLNRSHRVTNKRLREIVDGNIHITFNMVITALIAMGCTRYKSNNLRGFAGLVEHPH